MSELIWRVGYKVPVNVYEGNRPVCQCHNEEDARAIVQAMNVEPAEIALRCIDVGWKAVGLKELDDDGGCEGCETGWCQMAVDAACDARNQFADAIRKEFDLPIVRAEE